MAWLAEVAPPERVVQHGNTRISNQRLTRDEPLAVSRAAEDPSRSTGHDVDGRRLTAESADMTVAKSAGGRPMSRRADLTRAPSPRRSPRNPVPALRCRAWAAEAPARLKDLARRSAILIDMSETAWIPTTTAARPVGARRARLLFVAELAAY